MRAPIIPVWCRLLTYQILTLKKIRNNKIVFFKFRKLHPRDFTICHLILSVTFHSPISFINRHRDRFLPALS